MVNGPFDIARPPLYTHTFTMLQSFSSGTTLLAKFIYRHLLIFCRTTLFFNFLCPGVT